MANALMRLIKESFELRVRNEWLKEIKKETKKYNKFNDMAKRKAYVVRALVKEYNKLYPDNQLKEP